MPAKALFPCTECNKRFTRSENLDRHLRSSHTAVSTFVCDKCGRSFARSDVRKRHVQRCARGLHRRKPVSAVTDHGDTEPNHDATDQAQIGSIITSPANTRHGSNGDTSMDRQVPDFQQYDMPMMDMLPDSPTIALLAPDARSPGAASTIVNIATHGPPSASASSHAACYFQHFHPFLPIIHRATFRISTAPSALASIVVAIGRTYMLGGHDQDQSRDDTWRAGVNELLSMIKTDPTLVRKPWMVQAWLLHVVYGFYFAADSSLASRNMLHVLVDQMRSMCLLKQGLTFPEDEFWTSKLDRVQGLHSIWPVFVHQESFRLCLLALLFVDMQMAAPCNVRPFFSTTEVIWDIPYTSSLWNASSADEWVAIVLEEVQIGNISTSPMTSSQILDQDMLHPAHVIQHLMSGSADSRLLRRLSSNAFGTICVLASLEALVRDFTYCCYQMPPVLPDPSAFHILAPTQNRSINAAVNGILETVIRNTACADQISRLMQLMSWTIRLGLSEPDDLLVAGIADTSLAAGLATSTHCMLGSIVAKRRAAPLKHRPFGEDSSLVCWQDLLRSIAVVTDSAQDGACSQPPWMTALSYRMLLLFWRTLRRAVADLELQPVALNPAKLIMPLICQSVKDCLRSENTRSDCDEPGGIETSFIALLEQIFHDVNSPVSAAIGNILSEIKELLATIDIVSPVHT